MTFDDWYKKLKAIARDYGYQCLSPDQDSYREWFDDGLSPEDAFDEELYAAQASS